MWPRALIAATFQSNFNKNKVLEFVGDGVYNLSMEYRMCIDVMTTESTALSSVWCTDGKTEEFSVRARPGPRATLSMAPETGAYYDGLIEIDTL
ncbi:MAG: aconitase family protein [Lachnospiraceae bacterium]